MVKLVHCGLISVKNEHGLIYCAKKDNVIL